MKKKLLLLLTLAFSLQPSAFLWAETKSNDIRIQQYDGRTWQWVEMTPTNGGALTFDGSLQFQVAGEQPTIWTNAAGTIKPFGQPTNASITALSFVQSNAPPTFDLRVGSTWDIANSVKSGFTASGNSSNVLNGTTSSTMSLFAYGYADNSLVSWSVANLNGAGDNVATTSIDDGSGNSITLLSSFPPDRNAPDIGAPRIEVVDAERGTVFSVTHSGYALVAGGVGSTATNAAVTINETGWTNTFAKNAVVYFDGTAMTYTVKNNAGTPVYTNTAAAANATVVLQPSGAVTIAGTGVVGRATPF